jgi:hypothetical protein
MNGFEIWVYRGLIFILGAIIVFWLKRYISSQDEKNKLFFDALNRFEKSITKMEDLVNMTEKLWNERHNIMDKRVSNLEKKLEH